MCAVHVCIDPETFCGALFMVQAQLVYYCSEAARYDDKLTKASKALREYELRLSEGVSQVRDWGRWGGRGCVLGHVFLMQMSFPDPAVTGPLVILVLVLTVVLFLSFSLSTGMHRPNRLIPILLLCLMRTQVDKAVGGDKGERGKGDKGERKAGQREAMDKQLKVSVTHSDQTGHTFSSMNGARNVPHPWVQHFNGWQMSGLLNELVYAQ
jgi:hypothetical protein